jgi:arylsulfatase B
MTHLPRVPAALFLLLTWTLVPAAAAPPTRPPNVIVIVADDMGWNMVGYHGGFARTPNIDRIARSGVELDRFYVSPMCSPTRAGLLTGRYPMRFGMARTVVRPWAAHGLPPQERTLPEALADAGYRGRGAFGKWHLGHLAPQWHPLAQGFTHFKGCYNGAADYFTRQRDGQTDWHADWDDVQEPGYTTDLIADGAASFVTRHAREAPFFCYVAFTAPHDPLQVPEKYLAPYADLDKNPNDNKPSPRQTVAAMTTCMDDGIGRILKAVEDAGIARDTLIWFLSDNGGVRGIPGTNEPLRAGKLTVYEGGVRVPAAAWWPGVIEGGRKIATPVMNIDIMPTLLRVCGGDAAAAAGPMDGVDVFDLLAGKPGSAPPAARPLYFFEGQSGPENEQLAVTAADGWKLVIAGPDVRRPGGWQTPRHRVELFRLSHDPLEKTDLAAQEPQRVKLLAQDLVAFRASEPKASMAPVNRKPAQFRAPQNWRNAPAAGAGGK